MQKLCSRSLSPGSLARRSGQCIGANETWNCPRIWPRSPRVFKTSEFDLFTRMIWEQRIPKIWRQAKIIALPKPGKDPHLAASYWPISLLSVCYKLLERIILQRISSTVEDLLSVDQAGFCRGHSTCDQVTALTTFIENGFEKTLKTGAVFLDLTCCIWHHLAHWPSL